MKTETHLGPDGVYEFPSHPGPYPWYLQVLKTLGIIDGLVFFSILIFRIWVEVKDPMPYFKMGMTCSILGFVLGITISILDDRYTTQLHRFNYENPNGKNYSGPLKNKSHKHYD